MYRRVKLYKLFQQRVRRCIYAERWYNRPEFIWKLINMWLEQPVIGVPTVDVTHIYTKAVSEIFSWSKLLKVTMYCLGLIHNLKSKMVYQDCNVRSVTVG